MRTAEENNNICVSSRPLKILKGAATVPTRSPHGPTLFQGPGAATVPHSLNKSKIIILRTVEETITNGIKIIFFRLWGKFGERQNKPVTHSIREPAELFNLLSDPVNCIHSVRICNENRMELVVTKNEEEYQKGFKQNIFIAAFTTCYARLKLYDALEKLDDRVLYYDTDSVIFKTKAGQEKLPLGDYLGDFTDETGGDPIQEFCSAGAKNYGYRTRGGKVECKVKGFSLNYETKQVLNYNTMKANILKELDEPLEKARQTTIIIPDYFERNQTTKKIKLTTRKKNYKLVFDKRVIDPASRSSTPYGYNWYGGDIENLLEL